MCWLLQQNVRLGWNVLTVTSLLHNDFYYDREKVLLQRGYRDCTINFFTSASNLDTVSENIVLFSALSDIHSQGWGLPEAKPLSAFTL